MRTVADLHIHSRFSLATSSKLTPAYLDRWARIKGIDLVGTGDCTHPAWLAELREKLAPAEDGFFTLKGGERSAFDSGEALAEGLPNPGGRTARAGTDPAGGGLPEAVPRFVLTGEISTIYSLGGKTRKVHHLVVLPDFQAAAAFQARLERVGNIASDGRPILGIDSRDLFSLLLDADERSILVPAHIWTPWFSALGARSGFDSIDECYRDLAPRIGAIETGLSSNPPMNWAVSALDRFSVISNSDAHSPEKLGREATVIDMESSFAALSQALSGGGPLGNIAETVEFFPQEGKYHYDGHRACGVSLPPEECAHSSGLCPRCGKPLTPGVVRRVAELADRPIDEAAPCPSDSAGTNRRPYRSLIPLPELLGELLGTGSGSKKVAAAYGSLVEQAGSEFALLLDRSETEIRSMSAPGVSGDLLARGVSRMRAGEVFITPGYDGEYGVIRAFAPGENIAAKKDAGLFGDAAEVPAAPKKRPPRKAGKGGPGSDPKTGAAAGTDPGAVAASGTAPVAPADFRLDAAQEAAVSHARGPALIVAGPGTGKTAVLARRVERLIEGGAEPASILALTFTNKAARELRERIGRTIGAERSASVTAATFHSFCRSALRERAAESGLPPDFFVIGEPDRLEVLTEIAGSSAAARKLGSYIEARKRFLLRPGDKAPRLGAEAPAGLAEAAAAFGLPEIDADLDARFAAYRDALRAEACLDFDDLVSGAARLFAARPEIARAYRDRFRHVFVDEYQDINFAQYALVRFLAPDSRSDLFAIGDPNQAIYAFRGSDKRFIDRFALDYPSAATYSLAKSFRCAPAIIGAAARLVGGELSGTGSAVSLDRAEYPTDKSEAEGIARAIDALIGGTRFFAIDSGAADGGGTGSSGALASLGECAVLVRASALAGPVAKALHDHGLPFTIIGERPWWEDEPCRSIIALLCGRTDPDARSRFAALPPREAVLAASAALKEGGTDIDPADRPESPADRLAERAGAYASLAAFLDDLELSAAQDGLAPRTERVSVMTIHAAKGLEFDHVFVAGLEDGLLPFTLFDDDASAIDEERRLLYVAMTRARAGLHLSFAKSRLFRGRQLELPPSRFLAEIADLVPMLEEAPRPKRDSQLALW